MLKRHRNREFSTDAQTRRIFGKKSKAVPSPPAVLHTEGSSQVSPTSNKGGHCNKVKKGETFVTARFQLVFLRIRESNITNERNQANCFK